MLEFSSDANSADMDQLAADTNLINALCAWAEKRPSRIAAELGMAATTLTRPANGKATTRIGRQTLDALRAAYPDFPGFAESQNGGAQPSHSDFTPSPTDVLAILDALEPYAQKAPETEAGRQLLASSLSSMLRFLRENPSTLGNPDDLATAARAIGSEKLSALRERQSS